VRKSRLPDRRIAPLAAWVALVACMPKPNYLFVEPRDGTVRVELRTTTGLFVREERLLPLDDCGFFTVADADAPLAPPREIWRVMSLAPERMTLAIHYGEVPEGFTQVTPPQSAPPPLEPGGQYVVECTGDGIGVTDFRMPE
jgi:hypothetical protein